MTSARSAFRFAFPLVLLVQSAGGIAQRTDDPLDARVETDDVATFFGIYDAAAGLPNAADLSPYVASASPGVRGFIPDRIISAEHLAQAIEKSPALYADARKCAGQLGDVRRRVSAAFLALKQLYPQATFPQTYILIGAGNSGGTANDDALMIGLEVMCRPGAPDPAPLDIRLTHIIAHEMVHSLQKGFAGDSLLAASLTEGAADFIAELISGRTANPQLALWTRGKEAQIEARFAAAMTGSDLKPWLYNGVGSADAPGDLGYWTGYRIVRAYYARQSDKRAAIRNILDSTDAQALLAASGWKPAAQ